MAHIAANPNPPDLTIDISMSTSRPTTPLSSASDIELSAPSEDQPRGRLKRRRRQSSHSPPRAASPSRGHDRASGSRYRHHYRKHHRLEQSPSSITPRPSRTPELPVAEKRRRSDAELDHGLRGRVRERGWGSRRTRSPVFESDEDGEGNASAKRKRSPPPSRHRSGSLDNGRRRRSLPNMYREGREARGEEVTVG